MITNTCLSTQAIAFQYSPVIWTYGEISELEIEQKEIEQDDFKREAERKGRREERDELKEREWKKMKMIKEREREININRNKG